MKSRTYYCSVYKCGRRVEILTEKKAFCEKHWFILGLGKRVPDRQNMIEWGQFNAENYYSAGRYTKKRLWDWRRR